MLTPIFKKKTKKKTPVCRYCSNTVRINFVPFCQLEGCVVLEGAVVPGLPPTNTRKGMLMERDR